MGVYPPCEKKERCRLALGYLWKTSNCTYCGDYVATEVQYNLTDNHIDIELPEDTHPAVASLIQKQNQEIYRLRKEVMLAHESMHVIQGVIRNHIQNHGKGGNGAYQKQSRPSASGVVL